MPKAPSVNAWIIFQRKAEHKTFFLIYGIKGALLSDMKHLQLQLDGRMWTKTTRKISEIHRNDIHVDQRRKQNKQTPALLGTNMLLTAFSCSRDYYYSIRLCVSNTNEML